MTWIIITGLLAGAAVGLAGMWYGYRCGWEDGYHKGWANGCHERKGDEIDQLLAQVVEQADPTPKFSEHPPCRHCSSPAAWFVWTPHGCFCEPNDKWQFLCEQHADKDGVIAGHGVTACRIDDPFGFGKTAEVAEQEQEHT